MNTTKTIAVFSLALLFHGSAGAYESENAVPLTLAAVLGKVSIERIAIRLNGRSVEIETSLRNGEATRQMVGFSAFTPFFTQLGDGEMHADKTFSDLRVTHAGNTERRPTSNRRGYFMGHDITAALAKAGVGPLPDNQVSERALAKVRFPFSMTSMDWDGYVSYAWSDTVAAHTTSTSTIRYGALPEFGPDSISSDSFRQAVQQHCGDPDKVARDIAKNNDGSDAVMMERYELPIKFMAMQDVSVAVTQPASNWLGARPFVTLVCGLPSPGNKATLTGTVANANKTISVLLISRQGKGTGHGE